MRNRNSFSTRPRHDNSSSPIDTSSASYSHGSCSVRPKLLLLSGDEYVVASNGVTRTIYDLAGGPASSSPLSSSCRYSIEEQYNLNKAHKSFLIRGRDKILHSTTSSTNSNHNVSQKQDTLITLHIQEIQNGIASAGTGACTWEASIASALYFSLRPSLVAGKVLELGSGVGLAALLTIQLVSASIPVHQRQNHILAQHKNSSSSSASSSFESLTLSDHSPEVIQQCRQNLQRNADANTQYTPRTSIQSNVNVIHLDWHECVEGGTATRRRMAKNTNSMDDRYRHREYYDTIVGSDIVYSRQDIIPLLTTIAQHLRRGIKDPRGDTGSGPNTDANTDGGALSNNIHSKTTMCSRRSVAHLFGPNNRAILHELVEEARNGDRWKTVFDVNTEVITMDRSRMEPYSNRCASKQSSLFLHVEISHKWMTQGEMSGQEDSCCNPHAGMEDID